METCELSDTKPQVGLELDQYDCIEKHLPGPRRPCSGATICPVAIISREIAERRESDRGCAAKMWLALRTERDQITR